MRRPDRPYWGGIGETPRGWYVRRQLLISVDAAGEFFSSVITRRPIMREWSMESEPIQEYADSDGLYGRVRRQYAHFDGMILQSGMYLGPLTVAYETYGELSPTKDNAVLILHALSGDAHVAGLDEKGGKGWWDAMVGPGKGIDTDKYFVICSNCLGGCRGTTGPTSVNPHTGKPYGRSFPVITIGDMVHVQAMLVEHLGLDKLHSVIGGSMGGMQALEWAVRRPDMVESAIVIAAMNGSRARTRVIFCCRSRVAAESILRRRPWKRCAEHRRSCPISKPLDSRRNMGYR